MAGKKGYIPAEKFDLNTFTAAFLSEMKKMKHDIVASIDTKIDDGFAKIRRDYEKINEKTTSAIQALEAARIEQENNVKEVRSIATANSETIAYLLKTQESLRKKQEDLEARLQKNADKEGTRGSRVEKIVTLISFTFKRFVKR